MVFAAVQRVGAGGVAAADRERGVEKKKAVVALARKPLVRCWGMLKRGDPVAAAAA